MRVLSIEVLAWHLIKNFGIEEYLICTLTEEYIGVNSVLPMLEKQ